MKSYGRMTGTLISKNNDTPFLVRDSASFIYVPGEYFEIHLDAHLHGLMANRGLASMKDYIEKAYSIFDSLSRKEQMRRTQNRFQPQYE